MKEFDLVRLKKDDPETGITIEHIGTIVDIIPNTEACTIDFVDDEGFSNYKALIKHYLLSDLVLVENYCPQITTIYYKLKDIEAIAKMEGRVPYIYSREKLWKPYSTLLEYLYLGERDYDTITEDEAKRLIQNIDNGGSLNG